MEFGQIFVIILGIFGVYFGIYALVDRICTCKERCTFAKSGVKKEEIDEIFELGSSINAGQK